MYTTVGNLPQLPLQTLGAVGDCITAFQLGVANPTPGRANQRMRCRPLGKADLLVPELPDQDSRILIELIVAGLY